MRSRIEVAELDAVLFRCSGLSGIASDPFSDTAASAWDSAAEESAGACEAVLAGFSAPQPVSSVSAAKAAANFNL